MHSADVASRCPYITRPAISNERLSVNRAGQVVLKLKTAWRDGTSHHVMTPMEFMQRPRLRGGRLWPHWCHDRAYI